MVLDGIEDFLHLTDEYIEAASQGDVREMRRLEDERDELIEDTESKMGEPGTYQAAREECS